MQKNLFGCLLITHIRLIFKTKSHTGFYCTIFLVFRPLHIHLGRKRIRDFSMQVLCLHNNFRRFSLLMLIDCKSLQNTYFVNFNMYYNIDCTIYPWFFTLKNYQGWNSHSIENSYKLTKLPTHRPNLLNNRVLLGRPHL